MFFSLSLGDSERALQRPPGESMRGKEIKRIEGGREMVAC